MTAHATLRLLPFLLVGLPALQAEVTLKELLKEVAEHNPALAAQGHEVAAMKEREGAAGLWEDPTVEVMLQRDGETRPLALSATEVTVRQALPLGGRLQSEKSSARAETRGAHAERKSQGRQLLLQTQEAFFGYVKLQVERETLAHHRELLGKSQDSYRVALSAGNANVSGLLMLETERAKIEQRLLELDQAEAEVRVELNTLRGASPFTDLLLAAEPFGTEITSYDRSSTLERALAMAPELEANEAFKELAKAQLALAKAERLPRAEVSFRTRHMNGSRQALEDYDTGIQISLPWLHPARYRAAQREAEARLALAESKDAALRADVASVVSKLLVAHDAAARQVTLQTQRSGPLARQAVDAAAEALRTTNGSVLELLDALRNEREVRLVETNARIDVARTEALLHSFLTSADSLSHE